MTQRDDAPLLKEVLDYILQAVEVLKASNINVPTSLYKAVASIHNALDMQGEELPATRPSGQS